MAKVKLDRRLHQFDLQLLENGDKIVNLFQRIIRDNKTISYYHTIFKKIKKKEIVEKNRLHQINSSFVGLLSFENRSMHVQVFYFSFFFVFFILCMYI